MVLDDSNCRRCYEDDCPQKSEEGYATMQYISQIDKKIREMSISFAQDRQPQEIKIYIYEVLRINSLCLFWHALCNAKSRGYVCADEMVSEVKCKENYIICTLCS